MSYLKNGLRLSSMARGVAGALAVVVAVSAMAPNVALAKSGPSRCASKTEASALRMRSLQNHLMVAALSCNKRDDYNAFVGRFNSTLSSSGRTMKQYFQNAWGKNANGQLDNYVTFIANRVSAQSLTDREHFCATAGNVIDQVMKLSESELHSYTEKLPKENAEAPQVCL